MSQLGEQVAATAPARPPRPPRCRRHPQRRPGYPPAPARAVGRGRPRRASRPPRMAASSPACAWTSPAGSKRGSRRWPRRLRPCPSCSDETVRLREAINQLATSRDIGALEQAVVSLASGIERAQAGTDLTAIAVPIEQVRAQVERLAEEVAENVHSRVAEDVAPPGRAPRHGRGHRRRGSRRARPSPACSRELEEIRRLIGALAGPERIQSLAHEPAGRERADRAAAAGRGTARTCVRCSRRSAAT